MEVTVIIRPSFEQLSRAIGSVSANKILSDSISKLAFKVERSAKQLTPVDTGRLKSSIQTGMILNGLGAKVSTNTEYAIFVHEGTKFMRGRPFMTTGADIALQDAGKEVTSRIDEEFARAFKSL